MKRGAVASVVLLAACGRIGFDAGSRDGGVDAYVPTMIHYGKASNTETLDGFGSSVAMSKDGTTLAVAALTEDSSGPQNDNAAPDAGAVYVFVRSGNTWVQQAYLKASVADPGDQFGRSLAISSDGNTIAVGANLEDGTGTGVTGDPTDNSGADTGSAYVFVRNGTTWTQQAYLKASNTNNGDSFGTSVALSANGDQLAVGAFNEASGIDGDEADNSAPLAGAVYTFTRAGTTWSPESYVKASNTGAGDRFGESAALSDDGYTLAVGAPLEAGGIAGINGDGSDNSLIEAGAVYVFRYGIGSWTQEAYIKAGFIDQSSPGASYEQFGWAVALDRNGLTLAVGARLEQSDTTGVNGDPTNNNAPGSGAAYVFTRVGATWSQQAFIKANNATVDDYYGEAIALTAEGDLLAVGSPYEDGSGRGLDPAVDEDATDSGAVYTYRRVGSIWVPVFYIKSPNSDANDQLRGVAMSGDGHTLVMSGIGEDGDSTGFDGDQASNVALESGAVYVAE